MPADFPLRYDLCDEVNDGPWRMRMGVMLADHLREATNYMNEWWGRLRDWQTWLGVLDGIADEQQAWRVRAELVEPPVSWCRLRPSTMRDLLGFVATHAVHQANLVVDRQYRDRLDEDSAKHHLKRKPREQQLRRVGRAWTRCKRLSEALSRIDTKTYRAVTHDYRNLASHGMAPRFEFGHTNYVRRAIVPKTELLPNADGSFSTPESSGKTVVSYAFGGVPPLSLREMHATNAGEFAPAREAYRDLLRQLLGAIRAAATEASHSDPQ